MQPRLPLTVRRLNYATRCTLAGTVVFLLYLAFSGTPYFHLSWVGGGMGLVVAFVLAAIANDRLIAKWHLVQESEYRLCPQCWYPIDFKSVRGRCPECGDEYHRDQLRELWNSWYERLFPGIPEE